MTLTQDNNQGDGRLSGLLGRLEAVLDHENLLIGSDAELDLAQSNALKGRCLYEMAVLIRGRHPGSLGEPQASQLAVVRQKLEINTRKVKAHMDAVRDVTALLKDVATAADADGTYSADQFLGYDTP